MRTQPDGPTAMSAAENLQEHLEAEGKLDKKVVAARVDGVVKDLHSAVPEGATEVVPIRAHEDDALAIIRHSTAHVMADAVQRLFPGTKVAFGPATDDGFYYDYDRPEGTFSEDDLAAIEAEMKKIIEEDLPFRREVMQREELKALLESMGESYKSEHLDRLEGELSVYKHGDWIDLCEGPHVPSTRFLAAFKLTHVAGAYWRGDERNPMLQRIYGTAFANPKLLKKHLKQIEEAKKRDHRKIGKELDLFTFHPWAPASPFFTARGAAIYNALIDYVRGLYGRHGYDEIITPQIFDRKLFETSGHLPSYGENMFFAATLDGLNEAAAELAKEPKEGEERTPESCKHIIDEHVRFGVKPMNCPSHCLLFGSQLKSYRELPLRYADFGRLHRYERSGVTQGMTRVRSFAQDDGHIFCTEEQLPGEIGAFIDLVFEVYRDFDFHDARIAIATRPDERLGDDAIWDKAEQALIAGVEAKGLPYEILEGEGAFYGPKVEFHLKDALGRPWQLGTVQADFTLPERFELEYVGADNDRHRPVMLHRAVLGSVERFYAVLIEHVAGKFPTWLAPEQLRIVTVASDFDAFAHEAAAELRKAGVRVTVDDSNERLGAKIRAARLMRVPYVGVVGGKEVEARGLGVRSRDENKDIGLLTLDQVRDRIVQESAPPSQRATNES